MNLNLFLRPNDAREELQLKVSAQRRELERTLTDHGYSVLLEEGTNIVDAIIRSNPSYSTQTGTTLRETREAAQRINMSSVFGALSKHSFPIQNLLAAAKYASAYTTSNEKGTVLLLPHGSPDILRHTRRESMIYSIAGPELLQRNKGKPIDMQYDDTFVDPSTSVRILIQRTMPTFESGVANPDVGMGPLCDIASFGSYYVGSDENDVRITDFHNRCWKRVNQQEGILVRPRIDAVMSSAILAAPGASTGELLIGYPFTSVSTSSSEIVKIQLRVYLGAVMKKPENVLIMRHVFFEGLRDGSRTRIAANVEEYADDENAGRFDLVRFSVPPGYLAQHNKIDLEDFVGHYNEDDVSDFNTFKAQLLTLGVLKEEDANLHINDDYTDNEALDPDYNDGANSVLILDTDWVEDGNPTVWYQGTSMNAETTDMYATNSGHMGNLDNPAVADRLFGTFVYNSMPDPSPATCSTTI
jgi:hypothetical protein